MKLQKILVFLFTVSVTGLACSADTLYQAFQTPPAEARPFVRWWWNGDCVTEHEIDRELNLLKDAGIGGVEINPIAMPAGSKPTGAKTLKWLSPEWNQMVKAAVEGTDSRGMLADIIVGSGWPFGGRFLKSGEMIQAVGLNRKVLSGPESFTAGLNDLMKPPQVRVKVENASLPKLLFLRLVPEKAAGIQECLDLTDKVTADGTVAFDIPAGRHSLYIGTWQEGFTAVVHGAPGADGQVLNHLNKTAVRQYLQRLSASLGPALGGKLGDGLRALFCDSIELSGVNWTSDFPMAFKQRRGYDLEPWLPFVLYDPHHGYQGQLPENPHFADNIRRARYDFNKTFVELFHERFIKSFHAWCRDNNAKSRYQAYGSPSLMGMLGGYLIPDIPEGDTWIYHPTSSVGIPLDDIRYAVWNKYAASGAHLAGKSLVGCEAMTNTQGVFRATLEYIKQATDLNFITGVNHNILHGFNYSPPEAGFPGWVRYGTYFNEHNPWWPYLRYWSDYTARLCAVFQNSKPKAEVAILGPTPDVWSRHGVTRSYFIETPWYLHRIWQAVHQNGCSADYLNGWVLQNATFKNGQICFGPMTYDILLVASVESLEPATAAALQRYAAGGGKIAFVERAPGRSPGLLNAGENDLKVQLAIRKTLTTDPTRVTIVHEPQKENLTQWMQRLLAAFNVTPPVTITPTDPRLFHIHHRQNNRDIFFFTNLNRDRAVRFSARFNTADKTPWKWNPETGRRCIFAWQGSKNRLKIDLQPLESLLLVFEPDLTGRPTPREAVNRTDFITLDTTWQLELQPVQGKAVTLTLDKLPDLGKSKDPILNTFGGTLIYYTQFDVPDTEHNVLSLGTVHGLSDVTLNGKHLGVRWYGRDEYDVKNILRPGANTLEVKVPTVLANYCRALKDNPTAQRWTKNSKPASVGLLGPVCLLKQKPN